LFAVANDETSTLLFANFSTDGGATWTPSNVGGLPRACCDAQTAWDSFGNLFVTYINSAGDAVITVLSSDGGQTFSVIHTTTGNVAHPSIAVGPSSFGDGTGSVGISYATSRGISVKGAVITGLGGVTSFVAAKPVPNSVAGDFGNLAVGPNGQVLVTYE